MKALLFERNVPRFAAARVAAMVAGSGRGAAVGPLRLTDIDPPELPGPGWHRIRPTLAGICGSDLATLDGKSSRYFEDLVSFPFVPGHEVVGIVEDGGGGDTISAAGFCANATSNTSSIVRTVMIFKRARTWRGTSSSSRWLPSGTMTV